MESIKNWCISAINNAKSDRFTDLIELEHLLSLCNENDFVQKYISQSTKYFN